MEGLRGFASVSLVCHTCVLPSAHLLLSEVVARNTSLPNCLMSRSPPRFPMQVPTLPAHVKHNTRRHEEVRPCGERGVYIVTLHVFFCYFLSFFNSYNSSFISSVFCYLLSSFMFVLIVCSSIPSFI